MSNFDYYTFQINIVIEKINEEIDFYTKSEYANHYPINEYIAYLKQRIGIDKLETTAMMQYDNAGNRREIKKMNLDEYSKDLDILVYKKPWNKLKEFHKIVKIKEFINRLEYNNKKEVNKKQIEKNKKYIKDEICSGLKNKKFGKNKSTIEYDPEPMTITSVSSVWYNKKTGLYEIDWD